MNSIVQSGRAVPLEDYSAASVIPRARAPRDASSGVLAQEQSGTKWNKVSFTLLVDLVTLCAVVTSPEQEVLGCSLQDVEPGLHVQDAGTAGEGGRAWKLCSCAG